MSRALRSSLLLLVLLAGWATPAGASIGFPDPRFGKNGDVFHTVGEQAADATSQAKSALRLADGRIVIAGRTRAAGGGPAFGVLGLLSNGARDTAFGAGGERVLAVPGTTVSFGAAVLDAQGRILVAGSADGDVRVTRLTATGAVDTSYGGTGTVTVTPPSAVVVNAAAVGPGGTLVLAGAVGSRAASGPMVALRLTPAGALDTTFSGDGVATATFGGAGGSANAVAVGGDGAVLLAGSTGTTGGGTLRSALARFTSTGAADSGFGTGGERVDGTASSLPGAAGFTGVALDQAGGIAGAATEQIDSGSTGMVLRRYGPAGAPDPAFSGDGVLSSSFHTRSGGVLVRTDGRLVVGTEDAGAYAGLAQFDAAGTSIDNGGTSIGGTGDALARGLVLEPTGEVTAAVETSKSSGFSASRVLDRYDVPRLGYDREVKDVGAFTATGRAAVTSYGDVDVRVEFGTTKAYGSTTPPVHLAGAQGEQQAQVPIAGLQPETTYHARFVATNAVGTGVSPEVVFTTPKDASVPQAPTVSFDAAKAYKAGSPITFTYAATSADDITPTAKLAYHLQVKRYFYGDVVFPGAPGGEAPTATTVPGLQASTYVAVLTVVAGTRSTTVTRTFKVRGPIAALYPTASATFPPAGGVRMTFAANPSATDAPLAFTWRFARGEELTGKAVQRDYPGGGAVRLTLTVGDDVGNTKVVPLQFPVPDRAYNPRARGLVVTQGVQDLDADEQAVAKPNGSYAGVPLIRHKTTVVRLYADAVPIGGAKGDLASSVTATLQRTSGGGGPSYVGTADGKPKAPGELDIAKAKRDPDGAFTFVLPEAWTTGTLALKATVAGLDTKTAKVCTSAACKADDSVTLSGIGFKTTKALVVRPLTTRYLRGSKLVIPGALAGKLDRLRLLTPIEPEKLAIPYNTYVAAIDIDDLANHPGPVHVKCDTTAKTCTPAEAWVNPKDPDLKLDAEGYVLGDDGKRYDFNGDGGNYKDDRIGARVTQWAVENPSSAMTLALNAPPQAYFPAPARGLSIPVDCGKGVTCGPAAIADTGRPLTSVVHEALHNEGLPHAGQACPAGASPAKNPSSAPPWPEPNTGRLDGIGMDLTSTAVPGRFPIIASDGKVTRYDVMSYCVDVGTDVGGKLDSWLSPRNWRILATAATASGGGAAGGGATSAPPAPDGVVTVLASDEPGNGARIGTVAAAARTQAPPASSPYRVQARDAGGRVLADAAMGATLQTPGVDPDPRSPVGLTEPEPVAQFVGQVPATGAASLTITRDGAVVAQRTRSAGVPLVRVTAPAAGSRTGAGPVTVRWTATDPNGDRLEAAVDVSADAGRTWRTISVGPSTGAATLPGSFFTTARRAQVRVRVTDGFNVAQARSAVFRAAGAPPSAVIDLPTERAIRVPFGQPVTLVGHGFDALGRPLPDARLRWTVRGRRVGRGRRVSLTGLRPGRHFVTFAVRGPGGRVGRVRRTVRVTSSTPVFGRLVAPRRIGRKGRAVVLRVASVAPAQLTVGARRVRIDQRLRRVRVRVRPGRRPVRLTLTLRATGKRSRQLVTIRR